MGDNPEASQPDRTGFTPDPKKSHPHLGSESDFGDHSLRSGELLGDPAGILE